MTKGVADASSQIICQATSQPNDVRQMRASNQLEWFKYIKLAKRWGIWKKQANPVIDYETQLMLRRLRNSWNRYKAGACVKWL